MNPHSYENKIEYNGLIYTKRQLEAILRENRRVCEENIRLRSKNEALEILNIKLRGDNNKLQDFIDDLEEEIYEHEIQLNEEYGEEWL
ncbi:MAG: hypothetical protein LBC39_02725 [Methanobrevibacter sp.]|jgi:hypothetical protein|nr:hypothetical protein [Candidatus Methanovirga aequatorialis]